MQYTPPIGGAANDPYVDANPATGTDGSIVAAAAIEAAQREIVKVIVQAGLVPSGADLTQLSVAVRQFVDTTTATKYKMTVDNGVFVLIEQ